MCKKQCIKNVILHQAAANQSTKHPRTNEK